jgi:NADH:ubiquinone oxidoreductase subunit 2 (subunit N)
VLAAGADAAAWPLILILVITSVVGLYYLRIVVALYSPPEHALVQDVSRSGATVVVALSVLLIWFGVYLAPLFRLVRTTVLGADAQNVPAITTLNR